MTHPARAAIASVAAALAIAALAAAGCTVHRQSDAFACSTNDDCKSGRFCDQGFCVESGSTSMCPDACTSCDLTDMSCRIDCTANQPCNQVACPAGFDCTIRCNNGGACTSIDCTHGKSCDLGCFGATACGVVTCGTGACTVRCNGAGACPAIDCAQSCGCSVSCNDPSTDCPTQFCPTRGSGSGDACTQDGKLGSPCSTDPTGCDQCP